MTRDEAIERLKTPPLDEATIEQEFEYVASKLGISVEELRSYFDAPNRTYRDYRSQAALYSVGAFIMKLLKLDFGGRR